MDKMITVNKERLVFAREYYGFSVDEVAEKMKIKTELLLKCEIGEDFLTYAQLSKLADFYNRSLFFFFMIKNPPIDKIAVVFRKIQQESSVELSKKVKEMVEQADIYRLNLSEVYKDQKVVSFSALLRNDNVTDEKKLAHWLREKLEISLDKQQQFKRTAELIEYLREQYYKIGVYIFKDSFKDNTVSGLCIFDDCFPVILLNNKTTFNRQLFTIFHEVYHLFCKEPDVDFLDKTEEKACDKFAGEFLIPDTDFLRRIAGVNEFENRELISHLANLYTVSEDAVMYRMFAKDLISFDFYSRIREGNIRKMNSETTGGNFYYTRMSYLGKSYLNQVFNLYYSGKISISQVGTYTQLKPVHVSKLASNVFGGGF